MSHRDHDGTASLGMRPGLHDGTRPGPVMTRRDILRGVFQAATVCGAAALPAGCSEGQSVVPPPFAPTEARARVAVVTGANLDTMARDALEAFGGARALVQPGERVFIKTNLCAAGLVKHDPIPTGDSTKPELVLAVADECLCAGAAEVVIGDAAQVPYFDWNQLHTLDGRSTFAAEAARLNARHGGRLRLACLNGESPGWTPVPSPHTSLGRIYVSSLVARADKVISVAVAKTHRWTQVTGSLKNFVGVTPVARYGLNMPWRFRLHNALGGIEQCFLDVVHALKPDFAIIDCSLCCEGNGPHVLPGWWGTTVDMRERLGTWYVLASPDLAAADATAARAIGQDAFEVSHLVKAYNQGLGQIRANRIDLDGAALRDLRVEFLPAEPVTGFGDVLLSGIMMLRG